MESLTAANSGLAKGGQTCFDDTSVLKQTFVLRMTLVLKIPPFAKPQTVTCDFIDYNTV